MEEVESVRVVCRLKPLSKDEIDLGVQEVLQLADKHTVSICKVKKAGTQSIIHHSRSYSINFAIICKPITDEIDEDEDIKPFHTPKSKRNPPPHQPKTPKSLFKEPSKPISTNDINNSNTDPETKIPRYNPSSGTFEPSNKPPTLKEKVTKFNFDNVYTPLVSQRDVFQVTHS